MKLACAAFNFATFFTGTLFAAPAHLTLAPAADTYIRVDQPQKNFAASDRLEISGDMRASALLRFDLSRIPATAALLSARLTLTFETLTTTVPGATFTVYPLAQFFVENEANFNSYRAGKNWARPGMRMFQDFDVDPFPFALRGSRIPETGAATVDVLPLVKALRTAAHRYANLAVVYENGGTGRAVLFSGRFPETTRRPRLEITYQNSSEIEANVKEKVPSIDEHPRLGLNKELISQIQALRSSNDPVWLRFAEWLKKKEEGWTGYTYYGDDQVAFLLGYVITKQPQYFDLAWKLFVKSIYTNGSDRAAGLRELLGKCGQALYCDEHSAGYLGGGLIAEVAILYDWGFDRLTAVQRRDLIDWMNAANEVNSKSSGLRMNFRNDGAIIMRGMAYSAYATVGENPLAAKQMSWFHDSWARTLAALDVMGRGGALAEGNAYGEATGGTIIDIANMVYYASGENLFLSHPWFQQRLAYEAFSTYPNRLNEIDDPIYHANPPTPLVEGAALGGDDSHGFSWHSFSMRPNGLALSRRFAGTEEANLWNWVFRQPDTDQGTDPWFEIFFYSPPPALFKPKKLFHYDPSMGYIYLRSDWNSRDATWIGFWAGPHLDLHQHLDQGAFTIFKRRDLAAKTGNYDGDVNSVHSLAYYTRTVSSNGLLIGDPNEYFGGFISFIGCDKAGSHYLFPVLDASAKVCLPNDGGERTMLPYGLSLGSVEEYEAHHDVFDVARVVHFQDNGKVASWVADITNAYSNPRHTAPETQPKVTKVYRRFVYLREPDVLIVADTIASTHAEFEKSWLLHSVDQLEAAGDQFKVTVDGKKPANLNQVTADLRSGYAALLGKTVFPLKFRYVLIGGREPAATSHTRQYQPDPNVLQGDGPIGPHLHRHLKDFWVKDYSEGVAPDHRSMNWAPVYPQEMNRTDYNTTFSGGYGRWRIEVQPTVASKTDYFLNVLHPTTDPKAALPEMTRIETATTFGVGFTASGKPWKVTFPKETLDPPVIDGMDTQAPKLTASAMTDAELLVTTDKPALCRYSLRPGTAYVTMSGALQTTDGLQHAARVYGQKSEYYVRCQDKSGNETADELAVKR